MIFKILIFFKNYKEIIDISEHEEQIVFFHNY